MVCLFHGAVGSARFRLLAWSVVEAAHMGYDGEGDGDGVGDGGGGGDGDGEGEGVGKDEGDGEGDSDGEVTVPNCQLFMVSGVWSGLCSGLHRWLDGGLDGRHCTPSISMYIYILYGHSVP
jgi:hypothetical protein